MTHPTFGEYASRTSHPGTHDVELLASHPAVGGTFEIRGLGPGSVWEIVNSACPSLVVTVAERPHAEFIRDCLNVAADQLRDGTEA